MPNINLTGTDGDLGNRFITKDYLMTVYPQIAGQLITPELWSWGGNGYGQLGDNTSTQRNTPVTTFAGGANWKQVVCGRFHSAGIKTDGTLWTWGRNNGGQLGDNTTTQRNTPVTTFAGGTNWKQVSGGFLASHTTAIKTDGTLWIWGSNNVGQIGDNTITNRLTPVTTFAGGTNWKQVSSNLGTTGAVKTDGTLWMWGGAIDFDYTGQLGNNLSGLSGNRRSTPITTFVGGTNWKQISCGAYQTAAVKTDGTLWVWGTNGYGTLGDNTSTQRNTPVTTFAGGTNWKQVAAGDAVTSGIKTDGTLWTWGQNFFALLGNNSSSNSLTPVTTFAGGTNWKQIAVSNNAIAIKTDGTLWTWGRNAYGEQGINSSGGRSTPVTTFAGGTNWKQVDSSRVFTIAIRTSDDLQGI
jgi:alpha-tubulin suppressor-like RCC1 family protein